MSDFFGLLGTFGRAGLAAQHVNTFKENKVACKKRGGKMGFGGFFTGPQCYVDGKKVKLTLSGGSKKNNRKNRKSRKRKSHISKKRRPRQNKKITKINRKK